MGVPSGNWLTHLEVHEDNATSPSKVEAALIDARYARNCDEWSADYKDPDGEWHTKAMDNYTSAAAAFWDAYEDEDTPHIYNALATAARAASARAVEMKVEAAGEDDNVCGCDACVAAREASSNYCPVHGPQE